jgi:hypothetical protein
MKPLCTALLSLGVALCQAILAPAARALDPDDIDDLDVSYIYAAVMGTGTYKINGRRITMLQLPLDFTRREMTPDRPGLVWTLPVSLGYDTVTDHKWFGDLLDDDLVTLTVLPGLEYQIPLDETWTLKPFGSLGLGHDFSTGENVWMGVLGFGALATWILPGEGEIRWGGALKAASEYQEKSSYDASFALLETGFDLRWATPLLLADRTVDAGVYYILQYYLPEWDVDRLRPRESDVGPLHEIGFSAGLGKPVDLLGISFSRVRVGFTRGSGVTGWTLGTEFPF